MRRGREVRASRLSVARTAGTRRLVARRSGRQAGRTRTVVKGNYVRSGGRGTPKAFASANYMMFRPGEDGAHRLGHDGTREYQPHEVHSWVGEQAREHKFIYRLVMSPGQNFGEEATLHWANRLLRESGQDNYMLFVHAGEKGHTGNPHAHVLLMVDARLDREDFASMRHLGDQLAYEVDIAYRFVPHMTWEKWQELQVARQAERVSDAAEGSEGSFRTGKSGVSSKGVEELGDGGSTRTDERQGKRQQQTDFDV